jgi:aquaporin Z
MWQRGVGGSVPSLGHWFRWSCLGFWFDSIAMAYAIGHISGCHLNPAVSAGMVAGRRFPISELLPYVLAQVFGAFAGAATLYLIAREKAGFEVSAGFASNGYGAHSPGGYTLPACLLAEVVLTAFFILIILGSTDRRAPQGFAPLAIGLGLTLIHLVGIPVTNTSVNPARSTGPAIFAGGWALSQLWLFWVAPLIGGIIGGGIYRVLFSEHREERGAEQLADRTPEGCGPLDILRQWLAGLACPISSS